MSSGRLEEPGLPVEETSEVPPQSDDEVDFIDAVNGDDGASPDLPSKIVDSVETMQQRVVACAMVVGPSLESRLSTGSVAAGDFLVKGGTPGSALGQGDWFFDSAQGILHIYTKGNAVPNIQVQNVDQSVATSHTIQIEAGSQVDLTLAGVNISSATRSPINLVTNSDEDGDGKKVEDAADIVRKTQVYLTLADATTNSLENTGERAKGRSVGRPAIRCGWGSVLVIDDEVRNLDSSNQIITPVDGQIGEDVTLIGGERVSKGSALLCLDSSNPGRLKAQAGFSAAAVGSCATEDAGTIIVNGGVIEARAFLAAGTGVYEHRWSNGAAIGGGVGGSGTLTIFNGGEVHAYGGYCGSGVGAGAAFPYEADGWPHTQGVTEPDALDIPRGKEKSRGYSWIGPAVRGEEYPYLHAGTESLDFVHNVAGDIFINGGFLEAVNGGHGNAIGQGCGHGASSNRNHLIKVTGGTVQTSVTRIDAGGVALFSIGANLGYTVITGGSVYVKEKKEFQGIGGTAYNTSGINDWDDVLAQPGGALPDTDRVEMIEIDVSAELDKTGEMGGTYQGDNPIVHWDLSIGGVPANYGAPSRFLDGKLYLWIPKTAMSQRVEVNLSYRGADGKDHPIAPLHRKPNQDSTLLKAFVEFPIPADYQATLVKDYDGKPFDGINLDSFEPPLTGADGKELTASSAVTYAYQLYDKKDAATGKPLGPEVDSGAMMPVNAGIMKLTITSTQYSDADPEGFGKMYWGHRAQGWCEIRKVPSEVVLKDVRWEDGKPGSDAHTSDKVLTVTAEIKGAAGTAPTCKAPEGRVQLFVDGSAAGDPFDLVFEAPASMMFSRAAELSPNAKRLPNGQGGETTEFTYQFAAAVSDHLVPDATSDNKHRISLMYLEPASGSASPANYLRSKNPQTEEGVSEKEVVIQPVDPGMEVAPETIPDDAEMKTGNPEELPDGSHRVRGSIVTIFKGKNPDGTNPGRIVLKVDTPSSGPVTVKAANGDIITATIVLDGEGKPVIDEQGRMTLVVDPEAVGKTELTIVQQANGAYTATEFIYDVTVLPDRETAPAPSLVKKAENVTHPDGPTYVGDTILYTVVARNDAEGSGWLDVVVIDELPEPLELIEGTILVENKADGFEGAVSPVLLGVKPLLGQYGVTQVKGRAVLAVPVGNVWGGSEALVRFQCRVRSDIPWGDSQESPSIANVAEATGKRPDPADPDGDQTVDAPAGPTDPALPPGGDKVLLPSDTGDSSDPGEAGGADGGSDVSRNENGASGASAIPRGETGERWATIAQKLAKTGDPLVMTSAGFFVLLLLSAGSAVLARRRRASR